ncbi:MAG: beta-N-acetylhexosaminidase [Bacteroidales bacterium]|nr:beta-N-acetylhexosaminidase [Bacteroidales bacterium]
MRQIHRVIVTTLLLISYVTTNAQSYLPDIKSMTLEEKIGQLFMIDVYSNKPESYSYYTNQVKKFNLGGVIFFQGTASQQVKLVKELQSVAKIPLLVGLDAEHGAGWRLKGSMTFPQMQTLGAISQDSITFKVASTIARHCKMVGVHINFAPVADVNNNPLNPIINTRSFGEEPINVANNAIAYIEGTVEQGVIPVAKHFPGHGDTESDSHHTLPVVNKPIELLDSLELYPFKELIYAGCPAIMTGHLHIPAMDSTTPSASLSHKIITEWLSDSLMFNGYKFTDALNMKGARGDMPIGETDVQALIAGNDILLFPENVEKAITAIKRAVSEGRITESQIDKHVEKVFSLKRIIFGEEGFCADSLISDSTELYRAMHTPNDSTLRNRAYANAITLIRNDKQLIPLKRLDTLNIAALYFNSDIHPEFQRMLESYAPVAAITSQGHTTASLANKLKPYNCIIIYNGAATNRSKSDYGYSVMLAQLLDRIGGKKRVIMYHPATPYGVEKYTNHECNAILIGYEKCSEAERGAAQAIFGGLGLTAKLPVTVNWKYRAGYGLTTEKCRLGYTTPEELNIDSQKLQSIDSICNSAIKLKATPGCNVLIAKDGYVVYNKAFGKHKYASGPKNRATDIYDIASVTKVTATLPAIMQLYADGRVRKEDKIAQYTPELLDSAKQNITIFELLAHESRLPSGISFISKAIDLKSVNNKLFSGRYNSTFNKRVKAGLYMNSRYKFYPKTLSKTPKDGYIKRSGKLYMHPTFIDSCNLWIHDCPLNQRSGYVYSDLNFILLGKVVEKITDSTLNSFCQEHLYKRLGAHRTGYAPTKDHNLTEIVPSSIDNIYGRGEIHGTVHDPSAAILGGECGHAGLFSTTEDLAKIMQMYLQMGSYGGEQILDSLTIAEFTQRNGLNRRGLGFDKPAEEIGKPSPATEEASAESYGHLGFTGAMVWNDPQYNLVYIFLSNKSYPDEYNSKLVDENIRTNIQHIIYQAIAPANSLNN